MLSGFIENREVLRIICCPSKLRASVLYICYNKTWKFEFGWSLIITNVPCVRVNWDYSLAEWACVPRSKRSSLTVSDKGFHLLLFLLYFLSSYSLLCTTNYMLPGLFSMMHENPLSIKGIK